MTSYNHISHLSVKRTVSVQADGAVCIGGKAALEGVRLIENCTSAVSHNIQFSNDEILCGFGEKADARVH
jgi:hypothetical protein